MKPRKPWRNLFHRRANTVLGLPDLKVLDRFSKADLQVWDARSRDLDELHDLIYYGPEAARRRYSEQISAALNSPDPVSVDLSDWVRMVKLRYINSPLSAAGSLRGIGGRFNIGQDVDKRMRSPFPALYLAEDSETAYREMYQCDVGSKSATGLLPEELSLMVSSATFFLRGNVDHIFDCTRPENLQPLCKVLSRIEMPEKARAILKRLKAPGAIRMVSDPEDLYLELYRADWRTWPAQFGIPSASQQLAEMLSTAGYQGMKYHSTKGRGNCVALFPHNVGAADTFVQLRDAAPESITATELTAKNAADLCGWEILATCDRPVDV